MDAIPTWFIVVFWLAEVLIMQYVWFKGLYLDRLQAEERKKDVRYIDG